MRWYWTKIVLGACAIFVVGFGLVRVGRKGVAAGRSMFQSSDPIPIPLLFLPFQLDGREVGTFQRLTIRREAPKVVSGFALRVRVSDSAAADSLAGCRVTTTSRGDLDLDKGFHCLDQGASDSGLIVFGEVRFRGPAGREVVVPLLLDSVVVAELRSADSGVEQVRRRLEKDQAQAAAIRAQRAADRARRRADSIAAALSPPPPPPSPR